MGNAQIISGTMSLQEPAMNGKGNDSAVSEVLGEVMVIGLVVALAAIIGAMVFGLVGTMPKSQIVGVTATRMDAGNVTVSYFGGEKQDQVRWLNITVNGSSPVILGSFQGTTPLDVGNSTRISAPVPGMDHIIVVGNFADGTAQVLLDTYV